MIGSLIIGALVFWIPNSMYFGVLNVLIKLIEGLSTLDPNINDTIDAKLIYII